MNPQKTYNQRSSSEGKANTEPATNSSLAGRKDTRQHQPYSSILGILARAGTSIGKDGAWPALVGPEGAIAYKAAALI